MSGGFVTKPNGKGGYDTEVTLPNHMGGFTVTSVVPLDQTEKIVGWVDEYGTITDSTGRVIGDLVQLDGQEVSAIVTKSE